MLTAVMSKSYNIKFSIIQNNLDNQLKV